MFTLQLNVCTVAISSVNNIVINEWLRLNNSGFLIITKQVLHFGASLWEYECQIAFTAWKAALPLQYTLQLRIIVGNHEWLAWLEYLHSTPHNGSWFAWEISNHALGQGRTIMVVGSVWFVWGIINPTLGQVGYSLAFSTVHYDDILMLIFLPSMRFVLDNAVLGRKD
jgi:hypothetical protein